MPTRRQFMRHAMATSVMAVCSPAADTVLAELRRSSEEASRGGSDEPYQLFRVLFDDMSAEGASFGAEAAARGALTRAVGIDLGSIWMQEIEPRWKDGPIAIAGLTRGAALFCLELLARDYGMGVVYRVRHDVKANGQYRHALMGPTQLSSWSDRLTAAGGAWPSLAAALATACSSALRPCRDLGLVDLAGCSTLAARPLFSWVIAGADGVPGLAVRAV
jgi:hypothetical protein